MTIVWTKEQGLERMAGCAEEVTKITTKFACQICIVIIIQLARITLLTPWIYLSRQTV